MASQNASKSSTFFVLCIAHLVLSVQGNIECENLNKESCTYAISSSGKRCVLEKHIRRTGVEQFACSASEIEADQLKDWIETDTCIKSCGLDRSTLGISSDSLLESHFTRKLCSNECYGSCPNIVDLYFNLAAGEGVYLPKLCEAQGGNARRGLAEIKSSGYIAPGPESSKYVEGVNLAYAPSMAPF